MKKFFVKTFEVMVYALTLITLPFWGTVAAVSVYYHSRKSRKA